MKDLYLTEAHSAQLFIEDIESVPDWCKPVFTTYIDNANRALSAMDVPAFAAYVSDHRRAAQMIAWSELLATIQPTQEQVLEKEESLNKRYMEIMLARYALFAPQQATIAQTLLQHLNHQVTHAPTIHTAFESLLKSTVTLAWTALEILFEDLWEASLNFHPKILAKVSLPDARRKKLDQPAMMQVLDHHDYDVSRQMGTILKEHFGFHRAEERLSAYSGAFNVDGVKVLQAVQDERVQALWLLRNLIAHKGGKIDSTFLAKSAGIEMLEPIRSLGIGEFISVDGKFVRQYAFEGIDAGVDLIRAVNDWIDEH